MQVRDAVDGTIRFNDAITVTLSQQADITQPDAGDIQITANSSDNTEIFSGVFDLEVEQDSSPNTTRKTVMAGSTIVKGDVTT